MGLLEMLGIRQTEKFKPSKPIDRSESFTRTAPARQEFLASEAERMRQEADEINAARSEAKDQAA